MKRIIFTFLYDEGQMVLSRNFFRQKIGDQKWLFQNYNLAKVAYGLDEIMLLNISKSSNYDGEFLELIEKVTRNCFIPITVGGKIKSEKCAEAYYKAGADKILINNLNFTHPQITKDIIKIYGSQAVMSCLNYKVDDGQIHVYKSDGISKHNVSTDEFLNFLLELRIGEILFQSIDHDGSGIGLDMSILNLIPENFPLPIILMGGIGKLDHFVDGLSNDKVDAVATANILNFIGSSILNVRKTVMAKGINVPKFDDFT
jgi:cyclase